MFSQHKLCVCTQGKERENRRAFRCVIKVGNEGVEMTCSRHKIVTEKTWLLMVDSGV